jgi:hypothetical protein
MIRFLKKTYREGKVGKKREKVRTERRDRGKNSDHHQDTVLPVFSSSS